MIDLQSILIYGGTAVLVFFIAKYAELKNSKIAVWTIILLLSLVAGLRATTVGIDTKTYELVYDTVARGHIDSIYGVEKSFILICAFLLKVWNNHNFLHFVFAFITHGLIIFRFWKDREFLVFRWSLFSYYNLFFAFSLNGMRQFVATAIIIYATSFVKEGKYVKFIAFVILASLFHKSAFIGIMYLLFEIIFTKYFDTKRKLTVFLAGALAVVVGIPLISGLLTNYSGYFEQKSASVGLMMIGKIGLLALSFIFLEIPKEKEERYRCLQNRWYYFVGLLLNSLEYVFSYVGRIGLYFYVFESIYIGNVFKAKNKTKWVIFFKLGYAILLMYYLYENLTSGGQGELPYRFFWQS